MSRSAFDFMLFTFFPGYPFALTHSLLLGWAKLCCGIISFRSAVEIPLGRVALGLNHQAVCHSASIYRQSVTQRVPVWDGGRARLIVRQLLTKSSFHSGETHIISDPSLAKVSHVAVPDFEETEMCSPGKGGQDQEILGICRAATTPPQRAWRFLPSSSFFSKAGK